MKSVSLKKFIDERIKENRELFTMEEIQCIKRHRECMYKMYMLGAMNSRNCFKEDKFSN